MQYEGHRQQPMLFLVPVEGEGKSVEDLEVEALTELAALAEKHLSRLSGSGSPWLRYLASVRSVADGLSDAPRIELVR